MDTQIGWIGLGIISALAAAGVTIFGRIGLEGIDSTLATTLRSIIMAFTMVMVSLSSGRLQGLWQGNTQISGRAWLFILLSGGAGAASWLAYFSALKIGPPGAVAALDRLSIVFILVLATLFLGEQHSWRGWLGLVLLVGGVYMIAGDK